MGDYSKEHGERFHQDVMEFEKHYQGQYNKHMMGDYVWGLVWETQTEQKICVFNQQSYRICSILYFTSD